MIPCPNCHKLSIYPIRPDETAHATTCTNSDCRVVINRKGNIVGRWDAQYKHLEALSA